MIVLQMVCFLCKKQEPRLNIYSLILPKRKKQKKCAFEKLQDNELSFFDDNEMLLIWIDHRENKHEAVPGD